MENASEPKSYPRFFQYIMPDNLEDGTTEIPRKFVEKHESHWPKYACLEVSTGKMWKVQLKICDDRVCLHKGWKEFVEDCSIKCGYLLLFRYEGGSFFHVSIFDNTSRLEINYPGVQRVNLDQPEVMNVKEEEGDSSVEILVEWTPKPREEESMANQDEEVLQGKGLGASSARDGVLQRAMAFQSSNPYFIVIIKPEYASHLDIQENDARNYFLARDDSDIYVVGPDEKAWRMKYFVGDAPLCQVKIISGWTEFSENYHLRDGDACIFERLSSTLVMAFNVTIFRINEEDEGECNKEFTGEGDEEASRKTDGEVNKTFTERDGVEDQVNRTVREEVETNGNNQVFVMPDAPNPTHAIRREIEIHEPV